MDSVKQTESVEVLLTKVTDFMKQQLEKATENSDVALLNKILPKDLCTHIVGRKTTKKDTIVEICKQLGIQKENTDDSDEESGYEDDSDDTYDTDYSGDATYFHHQSTKLAASISLIQKDHNMQIKDDKLASFDTLQQFLCYSLLELDPQPWRFADGMKQDYSLPSTPTSTIDTTSVQIPKLKFPTSSLLDDYKFFLFNGSVELTHQVPMMNAVLKFVSQDKQAFQFRTFEIIRLANISEDFDRYSVSKKRVLGDFSVVLNQQVENHKFQPYLLFAECQRECCQNVFEHKDFIKLCIIMKASLKHILRKTFIAFAKYFHNYEQFVYGLLVAKDYCFLLEMRLHLNKIDNDKCSPEYSLKLCGRFHIEKQKKDLMTALYLIFDFGRSCSLTFTGDSASTLTTSPQNYRQKEEYPHPGFDFFVKESYLDCEKDLLLTELNKKFQSKYVLCSEEFMDEYSWENFESLPNLFYVNQFFDFIKINEWKKESEQVYVISTLFSNGSNLLVCRTYYPESKAINSSDHVNNISIQINYEDELQLLNRTFNNLILEKPKNFVSSWTKLLELTNLIIVTEGPSLLQANETLNEGLVYVVSKDDNCLVYRTYKYTTLNENFENIVKLCVNIKPEDELSLVNKQYFNKEDPYLFVNRKNFYWERDKDIPNLFVKTNNGLVMINDGNQDTIHVISKINPNLTLRCYMRKSFAIKNFDYISKISIEISDEGQLSLVTQFFQFLEKYIRTGISVISSTNWNSKIKDKPNLYITTSDGLCMVNGSVNDKPQTIHLISKSDIKNFLVIRSYELESSKNKRKAPSDELPNRSDTKKLKHVVTSINNVPMIQNPTIGHQNNSKITDQSINELFGTICARKELVDFLDGHGLVCHLESLVKRQTHVKKGASLLLNAVYNGSPVFVKINCYKTNELYTTYFQNRKLMEYLQSQQTSHRLNKILYYHSSEYSKKEIGTIFKILIDVVDYMKLDKTLYVTAVEPLTEIKEFLSRKLKLFHPIDSESKETIFLALVSKLLFDFMSCIRELHSLGIIHCDVNLYNFQIKESNLYDDEFSYLLRQNESPYFSGVLIDFNSSRLEYQSLTSGEYFPLCTHKPHDHDEFFEKYTIPTISFTKAHDIYSLSFVITQLVTILLNFPNELLNNRHQAINQFVRGSRNPTDKQWILRQWEHLAKYSNNFKSAKHVEIFSQLSKLVCEMFSNPWSFSTNSYYEKELESIKNSLLANKGGE